MDPAMSRLRPTARVELAACRNSTLLRDLDEVALVAVMLLVSWSTCCSRVCRISKALWVAWREWTLDCLLTLQISTSIQSRAHRIWTKAWGLHQQSWREAPSTAEALPDARPVITYWALGMPHAQQHRCGLWSRPSAPPLGRVTDLMDLGSVHCAYQKDAGPLRNGLVIDTLTALHSVRDFASGYEDAVP